MSKTGGRPRKAFTREQIDRTKQLLGRRVYPSRVAARLRIEFADLTLPMSYRLIEVAQREVIDAFAGDGTDPLSATYLSLLSVMAGAKERSRDKVAAAAAVIKLLGLHKLIKTLQDAGDVDEFLAGVLERRAARNTPVADPAAAG